MKYKHPNIKYYSENHIPAKENAYDLTTDKTTSEVAIPENPNVVTETEPREDISAAKVDLEEAKADDFPLFYECPICERRFVHHDSFVAHKVIIKHNDPFSGFKFEYYLFRTNKIFKEPKVLRQVIR